MRGGRQVAEHFEPEEEISLQDYMQVIAKRKWIIFWVLIISFLVILLINYITPPVFKASTTVLVAKGSNPAQLFGDNEMNVLLGSRDNIETQVEIIKSRSIAEEVLTKLPEYIFEKAQQENFQKRKDELRWLINILDFLKLKGFVANLLGVAATSNPEPDEQLSQEEKLKKIMDSLSVNLVKNTNIIEISSESNNPQLAADIANKIAEAYIEKSQVINRTQVSEAKKFIEEQLLAQEKELKSIEEEKLSFKQKENILYLDEETRLNIEQLANFQAKKLEADTQIVESKAQLEEIRKQLKEQSETVISSQTITTNPIVQQLQNRLTDLQIQLAALKEKYS